MTKLTAKQYAPFERAWGSGIDVRQNHDMLHLVCILRNSCV